MNQRLPVNAIKTETTDWTCKAEVVGNLWTREKKLRGLKFNSVDCAFAEKHYTNLSAKPFFHEFVEYIVSGPVVVMVWGSKGVVTTGRKIIGATNPLESAAGRYHPWSLCY
ncbi:hypothetical protein P3S67_002054 [Capsicum chacoense]